MSRPATLKNEPTTGSRCGSHAGHKAHQKRGEKPCEACFAVNKKYHREYYEAHREKMMQQNREYSTKHREARKPQMKIYLAQMYIDRREEILARNAKYRAANLEQTKARQRQYRLENPDVF